MYELFLDDNNIFGLLDGGLLGLENIGLNVCKNEEGRLGRSYSLIALSPLVAKKRAFQVLVTKKAKQKPKSLKAGKPKSKGGGA